MGLLEAVFFWLMGKASEGRKIRLQEELNQRRKAWLDRNGYDIKKQLEIERWCRNNIDEAIEMAYGYPHRSTQWYREYNSYRAGNAATQAKLHTIICKQKGIQYFDFRFPPKGYLEVR